MQTTRVATRRVWWTAALVLVALGGAGLAVAADRPHNPVHRPELTWRADREATPWIEGLAAELGTVDGEVLRLAELGQTVLRSVTGVDLDAVNQALDQGEQARISLEGKLGQLLSGRDQAAASIEEWRLGQLSADALSQLYGACDTASAVPGHWQSLTAAAQGVAALVRALRDHDDLVFRATQAGRDTNWGEALSLLDQANVRLADARVARDGLSVEGEVATLDDLLSRYAAYDSALSALYGYVRDTGDQQGPEFETRQGAVEQAQAALPENDTVMRVVAAETGGPPIAQALVAIEQARGDIADALEAVHGSPESTAEPEPTEPDPATQPTDGPEPGEPTLPPA